MGVGTSTIVFLEVEPWQKPILERTLDRHALRFFEQPIDRVPDEPLKDAAVVSPFTLSKIDPAALARLPNLKFVATRTTGYDHIDIDACAKRGVAVSNVPTYGENTVAEHTFALILALSRKIVDAVERTRRGGFDYEGLRGFDLKGKTLGVVGTGHIGQHVIRIAKGFEMNVLAFDVRQSAELAQTLGFRYAPLDELLKQSDIVTLHAPLNPKTEHLINRKNIGLMKRGSYLINTARGGLVETEAIVLALNKGNLAGCGLDVLEEERMIKEEAELLNAATQEALRRVLAANVLAKHPNVILTPHNAFNSQEALERILETTIENIEGFLAGSPKNLVR